VSRRYKVGKCRSPTVRLVPRPYWSRLPKESRHGNIKCDNTTDLAALSVTIGSFGTDSPTILELLYTFAHQMDKEIAAPPVNLRKIRSHKRPVASEAERTSFAQLLHTDARPVRARRDRRRRRSLEQMGWSMCSRPSWSRV